MSPLPWPLIGRRDPYAGTTPDPVRIESNIRIVPTPPSRTTPAPAGPTGDGRAEHAAMRRAHAWLRAEEDDVLPALADLTHQHGPWTAAARLFTEEAQ